MTIIKMNLDFKIYIVAVGKKEVKRFMTDNKHPNGSWFTCILRSQKILRSKKGITLDDILVHAEIWKQEIPYSWKNKKTYPNNCYGYVDSAIVSVFEDEPLSQDAIRW